jgi:predicted MPP superfamily phosphohydrolase
VPEYKFFSFSDTHAPLTDPEAWAGTMRGLRDWIPDVLVWNGDIVEGNFTSRHEPDARHKWSPIYEIERVAEQIREINDTAPNALKVWVYGNHDSNLFEYNPGRKCADTIELLRAAWELKVEQAGLLKGWIIKNGYKHEAAWRIGQVTFRHGCDVSDAGLKQDLMSYCTPYGLHVSGHTHRPKQVTQFEMGKALSPYWYANSGCLVKMEEMHYMARARKDLWGHGFIRGYVNAPGLKEGRKVYAEKRWDAETVILRMFAENWAPNSLAR